MSIHEVANKLSHDHMIINKNIFILLAKLSTRENNLQQGIYHFNGNITTWSVFKKMFFGNPSLLKIVIKHGWKFSDLKNYIDKLPYIIHFTKNDNMQTIMHKLNLNLPSLEGVFFPNTYYIGYNHSDLDVYSYAYNTMFNKLIKAYKHKSHYAKVSSLYQLLIIASLIQLESDRKIDMAKIATVFYNRLRLGMRLQSDPAVYFLKDSKHRTRKELFNIDSPYNTYKHYGLPPTPISLPTWSAIYAAAHPVNNRKLLYFIGDGYHSFFSSHLLQHDRKIIHYLK